MTPAIPDDPKLAYMAGHAEGSAKANNHLLKLAPVAAYHIATQTDTTLTPDDWEFIMDESNSASAVAHRLLPTPLFPPA